MDGRHKLDSRLYKHIYLYTTAYTNIYFIIFLAIGGIIIFRNEMKLKSKETVVTYSFPPDENITNVVSVTSKTTLNTSDSSSKKSKITTVTTIVVTENTPLYIDLNVASHVDLCKLNGIGDSLADAIISYREQNGGFNNIEEIMNVYGIGENLFDNIIIFFAFLVNRYCFLKNRDILLIT